MKANYHFFPASLGYYQGYSFDELLEEYKKYGNYIYWAISFKNGKGVHAIKVGDYCLLYYSYLPDTSSRILFVGEVMDTDYGKEMGKDSICPDPIDGRLYAKLNLSCISLEDKEQFSLNRLREYYHLISRKGQIGYHKVYKDKHQELIKDIEWARSSGTHKLPMVCSYFNENYCVCEFKDHDTIRKNHKTFIEENGMYYIEKHHLVEKNLIKKYRNKISNIDSIIDNEKNLFKLCPNCHREIHHGKVERRREKIKYLYEKDKEKKKYLDTNFNELKNGISTLEWLYAIYNCS